MVTPIRLALVLAVAGALAGRRHCRPRGRRQAVQGALDGYEEVPARRPPPAGRSRGGIAPSADAFDYKLSYAGIEGDVTQAHIHLGQPGVNGGISVFFRSKLGNGPAGAQPCPPPPATVEDTITAADVIGPAAQGIAPGELGELLRAMQAGVTYANVHSTKFPGGEIRSRLRGGWGPGGSDEAFRHAPKRWAVHHAHRIVTPGFSGASSRGRASATT